MRLLLILLLLVAGAGQASGDASATDVAADRKLAKDHYDAGRDAFDKGRYTTAMLEFEAAYALSSEPILIEDMAVTAETMGNVEKALELTRKFLTLVKTGSEPEAVEAANKRIERLTSRTKQQPPDNPAALATASPNLTQSPPSGKPARIGGSVMVGGGAALLLVSLGTAVAGGTLAGMLEATPLTLPALEESLSRGRSLNAVAGSTLAIGVALAVGGGVWLGVDRLRRRR